MSAFLKIGHRGACGNAPENTLRSVRRALELGVDGIEIDVRLANDEPNEPLVIHDATLNRTTNGRGRVSQQRFAALRALDAGDGEQIPMLREVIELIDRHAFLNIELKGRGTAEPTLRILREFLARGWQREDFLVSSFRRRELKKFVELDEKSCIGNSANHQVPIGILFAGIPRGLSRLAREFHAVSAHFSLRHVSARSVEKAHQIGLRALVYTVNAPEDLARMRALGVDGVFSDFPDRLR